MAIASVAVFDVNAGDEITTLETIVNLLRGNQIASAQYVNGTLTFNLVSGGTVTAEAPFVQDGIYSGGAITRNSALDYDVAVCRWMNAGVAYDNLAGASTNLVLSAPHATLDRFDLIVGQHTNTSPPVTSIAAVTGTPGADPSYPSVTNLQTILYVVFVPSVANGNADIVVEERRINRKVFAESFNRHKVKYDSASVLDLNAKSVVVDTTVAGFTITLPEPQPSHEGLVIEFWDFGNATANNWDLEGDTGVDVNGTTAGSVTCSTDYAGFKLLIEDGKYLIR